MAARLLPDLVYRKRTGEILTVHGLLLFPLGSLIAPGAFLEGARQH